MGKVKWGVIVAVVAAIVIVVLAARGVFRTDGEVGETAGMVDTPVKDDDVAVMQNVVTETGDADGSEGKGSMASETDDELQEDAESFVRQLAESSDEPVVVQDAEGFVGADRPLTSEASESGASGTMPPESEELDDVGAGDSSVAGADAEIAGESRDPEAEVTTRPETRDSKAEDAPETDARESGTPEVRQPAVELPVSEQAPMTIAKLLGAEEAIDSDAVFYVHTVQPEDIQGIWGIVHGGILENFAAGVAVHRGESTETYLVDIPRHADERQRDSSSSFLGKFIFDKTQKSYVYNYQTDRLGRNPDLIVAGQEIVIVSFTPEELIEIYKHFVREGEDRGGDS